jgi:hypothetical protein
MLADESRPVRRKVVVNGRLFVLEVFRDFLTLRPLRVRRPDAIAAVKWGGIYTRALLDRPAKRREVRRGKL